MLEPFNTPFSSLFQTTGIMGTSTRQMLVERFELREFTLDKGFDLSDESPELLNSLNVFLSQFSSVNGRLKELHRLIFIRLYLIKTFRGRAHALGKPSRGQRT